MMTKHYHRDVRTTLTLDDDVAAGLKAEVRRSGRSFKEVVNDLLRTALSARRTPPPLPPFKVRARELGLRPGVSLDRISELIEQVEDPWHR